MSYTNLVRSIVKKHPELKGKLKKGNSKLSEFQYVNQTITVSAMFTFAIGFVIFIFLKSNLQLLALGMIFTIFLYPMIYKFLFTLVDVQIRKYARELESDLLFVSEYLLVTLEAGMPLPNAIERLSKVNRPGGLFFKRIFTDFKTGHDFEHSLSQAIVYAPSDSVKVLVKRLKDSLVIGADLQMILSNFVKESSEKKVVEIKEFSKKLNPLIMMYLLLGIVIPSLGITFFTLGATVIEMTPTLLAVVLAMVYLFMFTFQYLAYSSLKFSKSTI